MGLGLLTVLVVPSDRAEPLRTPLEEEEEDRCDEEEEDEHRHALEGGEGDAPIRIFLRIFAVLHRLRCNAVGAGGRPRSWRVCPCEAPTCH